MADAASIKVEQDECATLSPDSGRFQGVYQQARPGKASEVRELLGLTADAAKAVRDAGICCDGRPGTAASAAPEDLEAADPAVKAAARQTTYAAFTAYVHGGNPQAYEYMVPTFDRYLSLNKAVINIALLEDIEVMDGATLTISKSTHLVRANKVIIHPTGRIVCQGATTFKIQSLEGIRRSIVGTVAGVATSVVATRRSRS